MLRYEACGETDLLAAFRRLHPDEARSAPERVARLTDYNPLAPEYWSVVDAAKLDARSNELSHPGRTDIAPPVAGRIPTQTMAFLATGFTAIDRWIHYANIPLARAWLRMARQHIEAARTGRPIYLPGEVPSPEHEQQWRDGGGQLQAVGQAMECFGHYCQALNFRPWGWARYRLALEQRLVIGAGVTFSYAPPGYAPFTATRPTAPPTWTLASVGTQAFLAAPVTPEERAVGPWRTFYIRWFNDRAATDPSYAQAAQASGRAAPMPTALNAVTFGRPQDVTYNPADTDQVLHDLSGSDPNDCLYRNHQGDLCPGPNGQVLTYWMNNRAEIFSAGTGDVFAGGDDFYRGTHCSDRLHCASAVVGRAGGDTGYLFAATQGAWHLAMLDELVTYCERKSEFEVIVEVRLDVTGKNLWTSSKMGDSVRADGATFALSQAVAADERTKADENRVIGLAFGAARSAVAAVGAAWPPVAIIGGAVAGLAEAVTRFIVDIVTPHHVPQYPSDVYGRAEPAMETFQFIAVGAETDRELARQAMPPWPPFYSEAEDNSVYGWEADGTSLAIPRPTPPTFRPLLDKTSAGAAGGLVTGASAGARAAAWIGIVLLAGAIAWRLGRQQRDARQSGKTPPKTVASTP